jgi:type IV pilus assembly protein PilF
MQVSSKFIAGILSLLVLTSCVTTTTGGFNTEPSRERAVSDFVQLAVGYFEAGDMAAARRNINNALALDSRSADAYNVLALVLQREDDTELARETFERALSLDGSHARARNNLAALLFQLGEYEQSYRQLELVTNDTTYENRALAFENLGLSALRTARTERAEYAFERALQLDVNLYRSSLAMAQIKFDKGEFVEAKTHYTQFVTTSTFYNVVQTATSLWLGIQLERRLDNDGGAVLYAALLQNLYAHSPQYQEFLNSQHDQ